MNRKSWFGAVLVAGLAYFVIGYGSAVLDPFILDRLRFPWRLAAWAASAAVFALHIGHERSRLHNSPVVTALHVAMAVALGAFLLAGAATVHATVLAAHAPYRQYLIALVAWPIITAVPAFLVALLIGAVMLLMRKIMQTR